MNKLIIVIALFFSMLIVGGVSTSAMAEEQCIDVGNEICELFQDQQNKPAFNGPEASGAPVRCAWVTSLSPTALVLRQGDGTKGASILSWRLSELNWKQGKVNGHFAYLTQICFSQSIASSYKVVTLCGEVGHSVWRKQHLAFLKEHDVKKNDPACVGGKGWCGFRKL